MQNDTKEIVTRIEAKEMGDFIVAGEGATIIVKSKLINSLNKVEKVDKDLAVALKEIAGFIEIKKNKEASQIFAKFNEQIAKKDSKIVVKSLWDAIVALLPDIVKLTESVSKILLFIGGMH